MRVPFLALLVLFLIRSLVAAVEKPFNFNETPGKLPKEVVPTEYAIRIVPNLENFTFAGSETVKVNARSAVRELVLNTLALKIEAASVDGKELPLSAIKTDNEKELSTLTLASALATGNHTLTLRFTGKINQQGQGLFYMRYQEQGSGARKVMLGTQFEATDARRFFPCWDEPAFRARFQLTVVVPENWLAVSNMPVESEKQVKGGKEVRFASTPPMSSYLNVFVAGELDLIESQVGPTQIRVIATKGKAEQGRYALEASAEILKYYNDYFGVPYPLPKLDQIAIPGGFGGAMENWGGITYYEAVLLFDPKNSSAETKQDIYEVIAHEMAHMWFGDLVTMAWWDNLWLNEGFASWMGSKCTAHFNPDWEVLPANYREILLGALESQRKRPWKVTRAPPRIQFNSVSPRKRKPTARLTTSPTRKGSRFYECWRAFSVKTFSATEFGITSRRINTRTRQRRICGMPSRMLRTNR